MNRACSVCSRLWPSRKRLGILGGTFDPVHVGHVVAAVDVRAALGLDRVLVVPAGDPWQKRGSGGRDGRAALRDGAGRVRRAGGRRGVAGRARHARARRSPRTRSSGSRPATGSSSSSSVRTRSRTCRPGAGSRRPATSPAIAVVERAGEHAEPPGPGWRFEHVTIPRLDVSSSEIRRRIAARAPDRRAHAPCGGEVHPGPGPLHFVLMARGAGGTVLDEPPVRHPAGAKAAIGALPARRWREHAGRGRTPEGSRQAPSSPLGAAPLLVRADAVGRGSPRDSGRRGRCDPLRIAPTATRGVAAPPPTVHATRRAADPPPRAPRRGRAPRHPAAGRVDGVVVVGRAAPRSPPRSRCRRSGPQALADLPNDGDRRAAPDDCREPARRARSPDTVLLDDAGLNAALAPAAPLSVDLQPREVEFAGSSDPADRRPGHAPVDGRCRGPAARRPTAGQRARPARHRAGRRSTPGCTGCATPGVARRHADRAARARGRLVAAAKRVRAAHGHAAGRVGRPPAAPSGSSPAPETSAGTSSRRSPTRCLASGRRPRVEILNGTGAVGLAQTIAARGRSGGRPGDARRATSRLRAR